VLRDIDFLLRKFC